MKHPTELKNMELQHLPTIGKTTQSATANISNDLRGTKAERFYNQKTNT